MVSRGAHLRDACRPLSLPGALPNQMALRVSSDSFLLCCVLSQGASRAELSRNVLRGSFTSPSGVSREPESLLRRVLVLDPHQRYSIDNVKFETLAKAPALSPGELVCLSGL